MPKHNQGPQANHLEKGSFFIMSHNVLFRLGHHSPQTEMVETSMGLCKRVDHDVQHSNL
jgi:hypothetical protein